MGNVVYFNCFYLLCMYEYDTFYIFVNLRDDETGKCCVTFLIKKNIKIPRRNDSNEIRIYLLWLKEDYEILLKRQDTNNRY